MIFLNGTFVNYQEFFEGRGKCIKKQSKKSKNRRKNNFGQFETMTSNFRHILAEKSLFIFNQNAAATFE
jgi:hypothetical protein